MKIKKLDCFASLATTIPYHMPILLFILLTLLLSGCQIKTPIYSPMTYDIPTQSITTHNILKVNLKTHRLQNIKFIRSPNCCERPEGMNVDLLVIHGISLPPGHFGGTAITKLFTNKLNHKKHPYYADIHHLKVSSHLLIRRNGEIIQYVPFDQAAYHAGKSCFEGRNGCNDFSIGIELEGTDDLPYEPIQYEKLIIATKALMQAYPCITRDHIVGHSDIAPGRKTDPGSCFDWKLYLGNL